MSSSIREKSRVLFDDAYGIGANGHGQADFVREMTPDEYLNAVLPVMGRKDTSVQIQQAIEQGTPIASPVLHVQWDDDSQGWQVVKHDGRHRALAARNIDPDIKMPVRVFVEND